MAKMKVHELMDADVSHISLVSNGAIRAPFKILKNEQGDNQMTIDLSSLRHVFKSTAAPSVAAVLVKTDKVSEEVLKQLTDAGFATDKTDTETLEGVTAFHQDVKKSAGDSIVYKASEDISFVVTGVQKMFESWNWESTSFKDMMAQQGVYPAIYNAGDILEATLCNILCNATSTDEASNQINSAISDYKTYVTGLVNNIPVAAFKFEGTKVQTVKQEETEMTTQETAAPEVAAETTAAPAPAEEKVETAEEKVEATPAAETPAAEETPAPAAEETQKSATSEPTLADVMKAISAVSERITSVEKGLTEKVDSMQTDISRVEEVAKAATTAAESIVISDAPADRKTEARKSEATSYVGIDTAFGRR